MPVETTATNMPHGAEQILKIELLAMIHSGMNPYDIIKAIAEHLETVSDEPGYAQNIINNMRTIYGHVFDEKKLLQDELKEIEDRCHRIEKSLQTGDFTEEEKARITLAINLHRKNAARLQKQISTIDPQNSGSEN